MKLKQAIVCGIFAILIAYVFTACPEENEPPVLTGTVTIDKTSPIVGDTLTAAYAGGNGSGTAAWQWLANDTVISGANSKTYEVAGSDLGKTLKAQVSYSDQSGSVASAATSAVVQNSNLVTGTEGLAYELINDGGDNDGTYRVRKGTVTSGAVIIPASYNGLPVTEIGSQDDDDNDENSGAFYNTGITSVSIPDSVKFIGQAAFNTCANLASVTIPNSVTTIGIGAFAHSGLTSVTIGSGVTTIGYYVFYDCQNLASNITVAANNSNFSSEDGILYNKAKTTLIASTKSGNVTIPNSVTIIGESAFTGCAGLTGVTIPNSVTSFHNYAFQYCKGLTSVIIPGSVTSISKGAFICCTGLNSVTFAEGSSISADNFDDEVFPEGNYGYYGTKTLRTAYLATGGGAGTYTREANGSTWTKNEEPQLPDPVGVNQLSGKTYSFSDVMVSFAEDNTYTFSRMPQNVVYSTGFYSWNTPDKTVILVLEKSSGFDGKNLLNKSEVREMYIEYLSSLSPEELENLFPNTTIEQYVDMVIEISFSPVAYNYKIENGEIASLNIKVTSDNGTTVAGCTYSEKASTGSLGMHYLLSITFDEALSILTEEYGQPQDGWSMQNNSSLSDGNGNIDFVILEFTGSDMRLTKQVSGVKTTKGWNLHQ